MTIYGNTDKCVSVIYVLELFFYVNLMVMSTADHGGYKFIAYPWHIFPHILSLQNNSWCLHILTRQYSMEYLLVEICGHQLLFCKFKICRSVVNTYAMNL